jgi:hypothetical protein
MTTAVLDAERLVAALRGAFTHNAGRQGLLQLAADRIREGGPPYTSVYLYMLHGSELQLEAWSGRDTDHTRIAVGTGVCGTAVATGKDQNIGRGQRRARSVHPGGGSRGPPGGGRPRRLAVRAWSTSRSSIALHTPDRQESRAAFG